MRRSKELGHTTGFEHPVLEERIYPEKSSIPKTIISIALAYPTLPKNKPERVKGERRGALQGLRGGGLSLYSFKTHGSTDSITSKKKFKTMIPALSQWSTRVN